MNRLSILIAALFLSLAVSAQTKPEMVTVQGGSFKMGNPGTSAPKGDVDERPVHSVSVQSFQIAKYELSVKEYMAFINDASAKDIFGTKRDHKMPAAPDSAWLAEHPDTRKFYPLPSQPWWGWKENLPMQHVTWYDAVAYCNWLSEKEGLQKCYSENSEGGIDLDRTKNGYRLPTEAEWEFAARGGNSSKGTIYSGSSNPADVCWFDDSSKLRGPQKIGSKQANELGIYDMSGNVWEWCSDYYVKDFYAHSQSSDPFNATPSPYRVLRGGSWHYQVDHATVTSRDGPEPHFANFNYGIRLARNAQ
ncbi:MAG: formylglycine-generating enzyme family protein [Bacteroidales bacterium]|nr:formylglycine-generating enzyme family protein [Bacteroidales bacterium]